MGLGEIIRRRREELAFTQDQVARRAGISKPYLSNIETARTTNPPSDGVLRRLEQVLRFEDEQLTKLAHLARTPVDVRQEHEMLRAKVQKLHGLLKELLARGIRPDVSGLGLGQVIDRQDNIVEVPAGVAVPIINRVAAGYPHDFTDLDYPPSVADEYIRCPDVHDYQAFAARVVGDSMEPDYREGMIVVFSPNTPVRAGDDCFVRFEDGSTTFKRYYQDNEGTMRLQPLNNRYPAETYPREKVTGLWPAVYRIERLR